MTASGDLSSRIAAKKTTVPLDTTATLSVKSTHAPKTITQEPKFAVKETYTLVGAVNAPVVDGATLGATGVTIRGDYAFVSYNAPGATAKGAVQIIQFDSNGTPTVISEVLFKSRDVNAITVCGNDLYLALASPDLANAESPLTFGTGATKGAALGKVTLDSQKKFSSSNMTEVILESYAANSIRCSDTEVIATDGNTGGLSVLDRNLATRTSKKTFSDARSADFYGASSYAAFYGGTGGQTAAISVVKSGAVSSTLTTNGATIAESKSVVEVTGDMAVVALNDGGVKMANLSTGATIFSLAAPSVSGLSASVTVSNSVSACKDLLYIANGEAGVYVGKMDKKIDQTPTSITVLGRLDMGLKESANDIKCSNDKVFVAAGTGGFKILTVKNTDYDAEIQPEKKTDESSTDKN